jgi:hypothetical protein
MAMCNTPTMPRSKTTNAYDYSRALINLGEEPASWFAALAAALREGAPEIHVQFVSGGEIAPFDILSLRNCLCDLRSRNRIVTVAYTSLPPFVCAAWLAGDERRIARDVRVWIPDLPERLLREGSKTALDSLPGNRPPQTEFAPHQAWRTQSSGAVMPEVFHTARWETDFRALADATNEWFPCWEYRGYSLGFGDLLTRKVVLPEWGFGGAGAALEPGSARQSLMR